MSLIYRQMNNSKPRHDNWDPCHPGLLHEAAQDVAVSRRRLFQITGAGVVIGLVGGGAVAGLMLSGEEPEMTTSKPAGITCITVQDYLSNFIADKIPDKELTKRIASHLLNCTPCRKKYDRMRCSTTSGCGTRPVYVTLKPCPVNPPKP
jgi:hypothetical protein